jgi:hypothetical protein
VHKELEAYALISRPNTPVYEAFSYECMRPQLRVYEAFSYECMRPSATSVCGLKLRGLVVVGGIRGLIRAP